MSAPKSVNNSSVFRVDARIRRGLREISLLAGGDFDADQSGGTSRWTKRQAKEVADALAWLDRFTLDGEWQQTIQDGVLNSANDLIRERDALAERVENLERALRECVDRFERCCIQGTDAEYAAIAVKPYRAALARPSTPPTDGAV